MRTPRYITRTLAAGAYDVVEAYGQYITIVSISASTIQLAIDDDAPQQIIAGLRFEIRGSYTRLQLLNSGAVASTVIMYVADVPVDLTSDSLFTAILASLTAIQADVDIVTPGATMTQTDHNPVAQTGVGTTQILAANANRKWALVTADLTNAGNVYLDPTNAVTAASNFFGMMAGGSWREQYTGAIHACSDNGTEIIHAYEIEA